MQAMTKRPPKCPECESDLDYVVEIVEEKYDFNSEAGTYQVDKPVSGSIKVLCPYCEEELDKWETLGFAEGACNYPHGRM